MSSDEKYVHANNGL